MCRSKASISDAINVSLGSAKKLPLCKALHADFKLVLNALIDGLAAKLGPRHPDLQQATNEAESLRGAITAEINRIRQSIQTDLKRAVETEQSLAARLARLFGGTAEDLPLVAGRRLPGSVGLLLARMAAHEPPVPITKMKASDL